MFKDNETYIFLLNDAFLTPGITKVVLKSKGNYKHLFSSKK